LKVMRKTRAEKPEEEVHKKKFTSTAWKNGFVKELKRQNGFSYSFTVFASFHSLLAADSVGKFIKVFFLYAVPEAK
jgi:hypothetical protein